MNGHLRISGSSKSDRTQRVQTGTDTPDERPLRFGVPQGSVLGQFNISGYGYSTKHRRNPGFSSALR